VCPSVCRCDALAVFQETVENSTAQSKACDFLVSKQRKDGGWAESYLSSQTKVVLMLINMHIAFFAKRKYMGQQLYACCAPACYLITSVAGTSAFTCSHRYLRGVAANMRETLFMFLSDVAFCQPGCLQLETRCRATSAVQQFKVSPAKAIVSSNSLSHRLHMPNPTVI